MRFIKDVSVFLDYEDIKVLKVLSKNDVTISSMAKIFENPDKSGKYLMLISDKPIAIYLVAKISERICKYLTDEDAKTCFKLFLDSIILLNNVEDKKIKQMVFLLLKEAMNRRIKENKLNELAILLSNFYDVGFKKYLDKLLFLAATLAENGDYQKAIEILDLINFDRAKKLKAAILEEWKKV